MTETVTETVEDVHANIPNAIRDQLASDSGFEDQTSVSNKPKKITISIEECTDFPSSNCHVIFELDGKQCGKSKENVNSLFTNLVKFKCFKSTFKRIRKRM